jgi:hypothetical protein
MHPNLTCMLFIFFHFESWTRQNFQILGLTKNFQDLSSELVKKNCYKYSCWNTLPDLLSGYWACLFIHWRVYLGQSKWKNINSMQVKLGCMEKDINKSELITATFFWQVYWEFLETGNVVAHGFSSKLGSVCRFFVPI